MDSSPVPSPESSGGGPGAPTNRKATYSVCFGVAAFLCLYVFPFGAFALGVPAITTGVHGRREIAASKGEESGDGLAVTGLIVGGMALLTFVVSSAIGILLDD